MPTLKTLSFALTAASLASATTMLISKPAIALEKKPALSLDIAQKMAGGCAAKAHEKGWKMNIAVVDDGANSVVFERMDGAYLGSGDVAHSKAATSAKFPFSTRQFQELAFGKDLKGGPVPGIADVPGVITFAGGLPIMTADKTHIGGIGVSGGTADEDEMCAQAGLDAAKDQLQ
jgi:glc operon protein GlcG